MCRKIYCKTNALRVDLREGRNEDLERLDKLLQLFYFVCQCHLTDYCAVGRERNYFVDQAVHARRLAATSFQVAVDID